MYNKLHLVIIVMLTANILRSVSYDFFPVISGLSRKVTEVVVSSESFVRNHKNET